MQEQCAIDDRSGMAVYGSRHRDGPKGYRMIQIHLTWKAEAEALLAAQVVSLPRAGDALRFVFFQHT